MGLRTMRRLPGSWRCGSPLRRHMLTVDSISVAAPLERVFSIAREIERWPAILPHYRWVRFQNGVRDATGGGSVEMAAWRPFGPLRYHTWWVSEKRTDPARWESRSRH